MDDISKIKKKHFKPPAKTKIKQHKYLGRIEIETILSV